MPHANFVHLRTHSAYSLSEGAIKVDALVDLTVKHNMPAVAMTDKNNLFGALEFSEIASNKGVQPIIGAQLNVAFLGDEDGASANSHLVLLVQNKEGYVNLMELISRSFTEIDDSVTPQVGINLVRRLSSGLLCLTGGQHGAIDTLLHRGHHGRAQAHIRILQKIFGDRLYMELQRHKDKGQNLVESMLVDYAFDRGIALVATHNVLFATKDMFDAHDVLSCISQGVCVDDSERQKSNEDYYYKSPEEMRRLFGDIPEAVDNTLLVARRCAYKVESSTPLLPEYPNLQGRTDRESLQDLARRGLEKRLQERNISKHQNGDSDRKRDQNYHDRLKKELAIIGDMGFSGYFLIVADIVQWAKKKNIAVGPGRGSGASSITAWSLYITDLDPIEFDLLFERFLNPKRTFMPDFDIDFCQTRRDEVIDYIQKRYGKEKVAQIITFSKLQARAVIRDVGRALGVRYPVVNDLCKKIPYIPANPVSLKQVKTDLEEVAKQKNDRDEQEKIYHLIDIAMKLEGLYRHASTHAAGIVIADRPLHKLVALWKDPRSQIPVTQFGIKHLEKVGLIKFDFLGLKTLSVIQRAVELINHREDVTQKIDIDLISRCDKKTYALMAAAQTIGVFQLESVGMRNVVLRKLKPDRFEDIIAVVALYRPGPMENIPAYIDCKHGRQQATYKHPLLKSILQPTFGIPIYQEQVMQMAQKLAGYSLEGADLLGRAMGKKNASEMARQRQIFKDGTKKHHAIKESLSDEIFDYMNAFAGYGFNKSHATAYALLSYQTAWLKANYPKEFMTASLNYEIGNVDKISELQKDLKTSGTRLLPPDINRSCSLFTLERSRQEEESNGRDIRYGLSALKNIGKAVVDNLFAVRKRLGGFRDIYHFFETVNAEDINRRMLESLIWAGAFDSLYANRKQLSEGKDKNNDKYLDNLIKYAIAIKMDRDSGQDNLFDDNFGSMQRPPLPDPENSPDFDEYQKIEKEKQSFGFYLMHPLTPFRSRLKARGFKTWGALQGKRPGDGIVRVAGSIETIRFFSTKAGNVMMRVYFTDETEAFDLTFFESRDDKRSAIVHFFRLKELREFFEQQGSAILITCKRDTKEQGGNDRYLSRLKPLSYAVFFCYEKLRRGIKIFLCNQVPLGRIYDVLHKHENQGEHIVRFILVETINGKIKEITMEVKARYSINFHVFAELAAIENISVCDF